MQYTYVQLSGRDGRFNTGRSSDLRAPVREHRIGGVRSTAHRRPLKRIYCEACLDAEDARRRERNLKTGRGKRYLNKRLDLSLRHLRGTKLERR